MTTAGKVVTLETSGRQTGVIPARDQAVGTTTDPTESGGTYVVIPQMTLTLTTHGGDLLVHFDCSFNLQDDDDWDMAMFLDTVQVSNSERHMEFHASDGVIGIVPGSMDGAVGSIQALLTGLSAGSHTVDIRWKANAGSARANGTQRWISAVEIL